VFQELVSNNRIDKLLRRGSHVVGRTRYVAFASGVIDGFGHLGCSSSLVAARELEYISCARPGLLSPRALELDKIQSFQFILTQYHFLFEAPFPACQVKNLIQP
jgi:hypothetical protein